MDRKNTIAAAAAFALIVLLSGCAAPGGGTAAVWSAGWGWESLSAIALAIMALILGLSYMASSLLNEEQLRAWTKREIGQLGYSAVILVLTVAVVANMGGWLKILSLASPSQEWREYVGELVCCDPADSVCAARPTAAGSKPCHIALAIDYLQILYESGWMQMKSDLLWYWAYSFFSNISYGLGLTALADLANTSVRPLAGLSVDSEFYGVLFDLTFKTLSFVRVQQFLLEFMWAGFFPIMMSIGLVLRTFHFSRKLGGMLVALSLAVFVVLPMYYVLLDAVLFGFMGGWGSGRAFGNTVDENTNLIPTQNGPVANAGAANAPLDVMDICGTATADEKSAQSSMVDTIQAQWKLAEHADWKSIATPLLDARFAPDGPIGNLAMLMVFTLVTPFLGLMTTLAAFKYLSPLIGGDVEISVLSRLI